MIFEWDARKAATNVRKHGVSFDEASSAFGDFGSITIQDPDHSLGERRFLLLGMSHEARLVAVSFTARNDRIRLVSARRATRAEKRQYENG